MSRLFRNFHKNPPQFLHRLSSVRRKRHSGAEERTAKLKKGGGNTQSSECRSRQERTCCTSVSELRNYNRAETVLTHDGRFCAGGPGSPCPAHVYSCKAVRKCRDTAWSHGIGAKSAYTDHAAFWQRDEGPAGGTVSCMQFFRHTSPFRKRKHPSGRLRRIAAPGAAYCITRAADFGHGADYPSRSFDKQQPDCRAPALSQRFAAPDASVRILSPPPRRSRPPACFPKCRTGELAPHRSTPCRRSDSSPASAPRPGYTSAADGTYLTKAHEPFIMEPKGIPFPKHRKHSEKATRHRKTQR